MSNPDSPDPYLRVVLRNGVILAGMAFVMGAIVGWLVLRFHLSLVGSILTVAVGIAYVFWWCRLYIRTRGLF